jgi:threonine 3-dehydrogenase
MTLEKEPINKMTKREELPETISMMAVTKERPERGFTYGRKEISTVLDDHEVLIKILSASFCGTDYHIYTWDHWAQNRIKLPLTVGHELCGEIIKIGKAVTRVQLGDVVSAETHIICGECEFCRRQEGHICKNTRIIGVDTDGCFAEYVKIPEANCFVNDKNQDLLLLSVQEPLGNAIHTMLHFPIKDKTVVVLGCGPIGLMGVDVAQAMGAKRIIAIEVNDFRRHLAKELGADDTINPLTQNVYQEVMRITNQAGVDVIGEFSGNKQAIEQAFKYLKPGGGMSMLGIPSESIELDFATDVVFKGIHIYGVVGRRIYQTWDQMKALIASGKLHLDKVVTHRFLLSQINEAGELMGSRNCGKIILIPGREIV